jgi:gamma-glutamyl:cysteine ligase YbdK (ATP-grasp superfamily)
MSNKYLVGIETEYFVLDDKGRICSIADELISELKGMAKKECAKNMIEVVSMPAETIAVAAADILDKIIALTEAAEKNGSRIFCYGTYPGKFVPDMRSDAPYKVKERILGNSTWKIAGRCIGFHCHYTLVSGIFDKIRKNIRMLLQFSKNQAFVDSYNILVALDIALTTFMQSSPFYQGKLYGKDSRMMLYRGNLGINGLYTKFQDFGALPEYKHIITEIMYLADSRYERWSYLMEGRGMHMDLRRLYGSIYDINWSPVKVNPLGTFELRGMDMDRLDILVPCAMLIRYMLEAVHKSEIDVVIDEIAIKEPFKREGGKVYLPPFGYLSGVLQKNSAKSGMRNRSVRSYCKSFLKFALPLLPSDKKTALRPLLRMVATKSTVSDEIIRLARKIGARKVIGQDHAAELSLKLTDVMENDIKKAEKVIKVLE